MKQGIILPEPWVELLSSMPENGAGYQIVDIELKDNTTLNKVIVLNCSVIELDDKLIWDNNNIKSIKLSS